MRDEGLESAVMEADSWPWRRAISWARAGLAAALLMLADWRESAAGAAAVAVFTLFSLTALWSRRLRRWTLPSLLADTALFLLLVDRLGAQHSWLAPVFVWYLMASAVSLHEWREIALVAGVCGTFLAATRGNELVERWPVYLGLPAFALAAGARKRQLQRRLSASLEHAKRLRHEAEEARRAERQRIAADFHDGPLQDCIGLVMRLDLARKRLERDPSQAPRELEELHQLAQSRVQEMRAFLRNIRPLEVERTGLVVALEQTVRDFQKNSPIVASFRHTGQADGIPTEKSHEVVQLVREALHNVQKHAQATRAAVTLAQSQDWLELSVEDNGRGLSFSGSFDLEELETLGLGPKSIMRRVRSLGGDLVLDSRPGRGTRLRLRVPV